MRFEQMFRFLLAVDRAGLETGEAAHLAGIVGGIAAREFRVTEAATPDAAMHAIQMDASIGCVLLEWNNEGPFAAIADLFVFLRKRGLEMPVFMFTRRHLLGDIPAETLAAAAGFVFTGEDTPEFIARNLADHLARYAETLKTPFFGAMVDYAEQGNQLWTCPGHNGGVFYRKSPIGNAFVEHLGEAVFRNDLDNSVVELGDLLVHEGPAKQAEVEAAKIFGAERTYFVLNGTSTSNKIALSAIIAPGDLVLFDRNNHKAAVHGALLLGGGIPIYVETVRNAQGLIGPMAHDALEESALREAIRRNPLVRDAQAAAKARPFRAVVLEQCTYDGTIYSADMLYDKFRHLCDYVLFDEAWAGFMKFHGLFKGRFAMGLEPRAGDAGIIATQSTHKQLAGFSQASQIHIKDSHLHMPRRVEPRRFNELYMLHYSTSPFYPLFASLDVGAQMMKGKAGEALWDDTIRLGIELRKKLRQLKAHFETEKPPGQQWFFDPFVPDRVALPDGEAAWESLSTDLLAADPACWALEPHAAWHGFGRLAPGYAMTDPNKLTLLTPGFDRATGAYAEQGVPAPVLAEFLRERRVVPEKNDFNSILFLLTPGLESSKAGTLLSALLAFKTMHDENAPLDAAMPDFARRHAARYSCMGLRDLCDSLHNFYRLHQASRLQREQFAAAHLPEIAMPPRQAWEHFLRNEVDYLPLDALEGRVAATLALVYPPGIGLIVPGERYGGRARPMLDYLKTVEEGCNRFPGFEAEIQGVYRERDRQGRTHLFTYVLKPEFC